MRHNSWRGLSFNYADFSAPGRRATRWQINSALLTTCRMLSPNRELVHLPDRMSEKSPIVLRVNHSTDRATPLCADDDQLADNSAKGSKRRNHVRRVIHFEIIAAPPPLSERRAICRRSL
jgi:hypothetical protein